MEERDMAAGGFEKAVGRAYEAGLQFCAELQNARGHAQYEDRTAEAAVLSQAHRDSHAIAMRIGMARTMAPSVAERADPTVGEVIESAINKAYELGLEAAAQMDNAIYYARGETRAQLVDRLRHLRSEMIQIAVHLGVLREEDRPDGDHKALIAAFKQGCRFREMSAQRWPDDSEILIRLRAEK